MNSNARVHDAMVRRSQQFALNGLALSIILQWTLLLTSVTASTITSARASRSTSANGYRRGWSTKRHSET